MTRSLLVLLAAIVAVVTLVVLYLIPGGKETPPPPEALAALKPADHAKALPTVHFTDAAGRAYSLKSYKGRFILLNLWASWCAPCVKELPALAGLQRAISSKQLAVVTVDVEKAAKDKAAKFLIAHGAAGLPAFTDSDLKLMQALGVYGLPTSILISRDGHEIARAVGPANWDAPAAIGYFQTLTASKTPGS